MADTDQMNEFTPGTRRLFDVEGRTLPGDAHLKKKGDIVLIPQPTESPNDPLNWSVPRKILHSALVLTAVAYTAATSNDAGAAADGQNEELGIDYSVANNAAGVLFVGIGYWTLLSAPAVSLYGRRILYLFGMLLGFGGCLWFGKVQKPSDSMGSQLFVGASESVAEATVQLSLMDLWFAHDIGKVLGLYVFFTGAGTYLGPLIAGYIADSDLGWRWIGYFGAIFSAMLFLVFYFLLEETEFHRERYLINSGERYLLDGVKVKDSQKDQTSNTPPTSDQEAAVVDKNEKLPTDLNQSGETPAELERNRQSVSYVRKKTYLQRIALITPAPNLQGIGFKQYFQRLFHILRVFSWPAVWFAGITWGMQNACLTFYLTVEDTLWYEEPYLYSNAAVGLMNLPCLIGALFGCLLAGYGSDYFVIWMTKRNGGIMESEHRLMLMYTVAVIFPIGMFLFGIGSEKGWSWPVPYVGLGFIGYGYGGAGDLSMAYLVDCYPECVLEAMVGVAVINNTIAMIFTFATSPWIDASGTQNAFVAMGFISFASLMLTAPMMYWGKAARRWTRDSYLKFLEIRDGFER